MKALKKVAKIPLYEMPRKSKIFCKASDGSSYLTFDHIDGMYSYCVTEKGAVVHLRFSTEITKLSDGTYTLAL